MTAPFLDLLITEIESADLFVEHINHFRYTERVGKWTCTITKTRPGKYLGVVVGDGETLYEAMLLAYNKIKDAELEDLIETDPNKHLGKYIGDPESASVVFDMSSILSRLIPKSKPDRRI